MYQPVHEEVIVAGVFRHGSFQPKKFLWKNRELPVEEITMQARVKDAGVRKQFYSVVSQGNLYRLCYTLDSQEWELVEVWDEG
jgi:hypothetical protein